MSQSDAEMASKLFIGVSKFIAVEIEKEDQGIEIALIGPQNVREIKEYPAKNVKKRSKIFEEIAETSAFGDKNEKGDEGSRPLSEPEVILNEDIIIEISKYLGFRDLKSIRCLNKLWAAGAMRQLGKHSVISLIYGKRSEKQLRALEKETENLRGIAKIKVNLNKLRHFGFDKEVELFRNIFSKNAPTLQALELNQWFDDAFFFTGGGASISLPALNNITFKNGYLDIQTYSNCTNRDRGHRLSQSLYAVAPNLTKIVVDHFVPNNILCPLLSKDTAGSRNWSLAPKLSSLTISVSLYSEEGSSELWLPLVNFPQTWENLDITLNPFNYKLYDDIEALFRLLEKNKDTLVTLKLDIMDDDGMPLPFSLQSQTIRLPATFSKLKKLELEFCDLCSDVTFGGRGLNYFEVMPNLTSLSVKLPITKVNKRRIWSSLFPPQVFQGLKYLKVEEMSHIRFLHDLEDAQNWAAGIFPEATTEFTLL